MTELLINKRAIREWHRSVSPGEFQCSYWDCGKSINVGDEYFADYDEEQEPYCVSCAATFMMHSSNEMFKFLSSQQ